MPCSSNKAPRPTRYRRWSGYRDVSVSGVPGRGRQIAGTLNGPLGRLGILPGESGGIPRPGNRRGPLTEADLAASEGSALFDADGKPKPATRAGAGIALLAASAAIFYLFAYA